MSWKQGQYDPRIVKDTGLTVYGPRAILNVKPTSIHNKLELSKEDLDAIYILTGMNIQFAVDHPEYWEDAAMGFDANWSREGPR